MKKRLSTTDRQRQTHRKRMIFHYKNSRQQRAFKGQNWKRVLEVVFSRSGLHLLQAKTFTGLRVKSPDIERNKHHFKKISKEIFGGHFLGLYGLANVAFASGVGFDSEKLNKTREVSKREELGLLTAGFNSKTFSSYFRHRK